MTQSQKPSPKRFYDEITREIGNIANFLPNKIISWRIYWYSLPISLITATIFLPSQITFSVDLAKWALVGVVSHIGMAPFVVYANGKTEKSIQILMIVCMGGVRGALISLLAPILGIDDPIALPIRVLNSAIAVFYWAQILAIFLQIRSTYKMKLQELLRRAIYEIDNSSELNTKNSPVLKYDEIIDLIGNLKTTISADAKGPLSLKQQIDSIDALIEKHIKPQSSKRWTQSELIWPTITFSHMLRDSLTRTRVPVFAITVLTFPFSIVGSVVRNGFWAGILSEILFTSMIFGIYFIGRRLVPSENGFLRFNLFVIGLATVSIYPVINLFFALALPETWGNYVNPLAVQVLSMFLYDAFLIAGNILLLHQRVRSAALNNLESLLSNTQVSDFLFQSSAAKSEADLAQYLHAEVQAQLHACKLLLLKAAESDFQLFSPQVTTMVVKRLETLQVPYAKTPPRIPSQRIKEIAQTWAGLSTITYSLPAELDVTTPNGEVIAQLIEEAIVNAIRHGKAKFIEIEGEIVRDICHILITNDGELVSGEHRGLGATLFDTFADKWEIYSEPDGTRLTFSLPLTKIGAEA